MVMSALPQNDPRDDRMFHRKFSDSLIWFPFPERTVSCVRRFMTSDQLIARAVRDEEDRLVHAHLGSRPSHHALDEEPRAEEDHFPMRDGVTRERHRRSLPFPPGNPSTSASRLSSATRSANS